MRDGAGQTWTGAVPAPSLRPLGRLAAVGTGALLLPGLLSPGGAAAVAPSAASDSSRLPGPFETRQLEHMNTAVDREPNQGGLVQTPDGTWYFGHTTATATRRGVRCPFCG
ncbi:hypothetical protein [Streptomyces sp. NPDC001100]